MELLGGVDGSGYKDGAWLARRADGQMVHLGPLMYGLLEAVNGERDVEQVAAVMSERLGRQVGAEHVVALVKKVGGQGLLAGTESLAPPRSNPLLALRFKVLVTDPKLTRRLTAPFMWLFSPVVIAPVALAFLGVFWFVLFHKGIASATAQAFHSPGLLLLVFGLAIVSAAFHEIGHAAACRYGGAKPTGMGMGMYLVWPAFYTDVTDAYRLPRRDRLRVDLGGMYFNAIIAVVTLGVWLLTHVDALLLLVGLQVLEMVKNLSPMIRSDGYHILSDATGVPDLYSHLLPTVRRLLPWRREPTALRGRARLLVTVWVLVIVPVMLAMLFSAVLLLPKLATNAYESGSHIVSAMPHQVSDGQVLDVLASVLRLVALGLPLLGSVLVASKLVRTIVTKARGWSAGSAGRQAVAVAAGVAALAGIAYAWWPAGQYQPVRPGDSGTIGGALNLVSSPGATVRPSPVAAVPAAPVKLAPGRHLAVSMIPVGGASRRHPALFVIQGGHGRPAVAILSTTAKVPTGMRTGVPAGSTAAAATATSAAATTTSETTSSSSTAAPAPPAGTSTTATAFPFTLPSAPGPHGTQALAVNQTDGAVKYDVAYSLVTVTGGAPVDETNSAYAIANCHSCSTVAVSFQVVLIVGTSKLIAPINAAGSLNYNCPACVTTAIADQIVVTLSATPSPALITKLTQALQALNALPSLGAGGTPTAIASAVSTVQQQIDTELNDSGLLPKDATSSSTGQGQTTSTSSSSSSTTTAQSTPSTTASQSTAPLPATASSSSTTATSTTPTSATTSSAPASTTTSATSSAASTAPSAGSTTAAGTPAG